MLKEIVTEKITNEKKVEFSAEEIEQLILGIAEEQTPSSMEGGVLQVVREIVQEILDKKIEMDFLDEKNKTKLIEIIRERLKKAGIKIINANVIALENFKEDLNPEIHAPGGSENTSDTVVVK